MVHKNILVVSDNEYILTFFIGLLQEKPELQEGRTFAFVCGPRNEALAGKVFGDFTVEPCNVKKQYEELINTYDLIISAHCKQLFPDELTTRCTCINIHPGLNPYNRGWYPQVFSILNGLPLGATIHVIDAEIDHGDIIDQKEVPVYQWDTSLDAYNRVQQTEEELVRRSLESILEGTYRTTKPSEEGKVNLRKDFDALREIDLNEQISFGQAIDRLRALTHGQFKNAYFYDKATGKKVNVSIHLELDES